MISIKSSREVEIMRRAGKIAGLALKTAGEMIAPGVSTKKIDTQLKKVIESHGAKPSFYGYVVAGKAFPGNACISINDEVIHGIPGDNIILKEGDVVKIDVGACFGGYHGDCANTFYCGSESSMPNDTKKLIDVTKQSFFEGIKYASAMNRIGDIGGAIQAYVESNGFSVVRDYIGHGLGSKLHEPPDVPNFGKPGKGQRLIENMTIAIEPMVNIGGYHVKVADDKWTVRTADGSLSAHYEHTILIRKDGCELLTLVD